MRKRKRGLQHVTGSSLKPFGNIEECNLMYWELRQSFFPAFGRFGLVRRVFEAGSLESDLSYIINAIWSLKPGEVQSAEQRRSKKSKRL